MHNLKNVIKFEVTRALKKWSFWVSLLALPLIIVIIYSLTTLSAIQSQQKIADLSKEDIKNIQVIDHSGLITPEISKHFNLTITSPDAQQAAINKVKEGQSDLLIVYPSNPSAQNIQLYAKEISLFENEKYTTAANTILKTAASAHVSNELALPIIANNNLQINTISYQDGQPVGGLERVLLPIMFLVVFYLVLLLLSNQMVVSTTEEKENRVTEIILTTISSKTLILGKIISLFIIGLIQIAVIILPVVILSTIFKPEISQLSSTTANLDLATATISLHQFAVGFLALTGGLAMLTGLLVAIGAAVPTAKEANNFLGIVLLVMFIPLYVLMTIVTEPNSPIVIALSLFPLSAPITIMIENAFGVLNPHIAQLGLLIIWVTAGLFLIMAARIFKYGTLEYRRRLSIKEIASRKYRA